MCFKYALGKRMVNCADNKECDSVKVFLLMLVDPNIAFVVYFTLVQGWVGAILRFNRIGRHKIAYYYELRRVRRLIASWCR
jgi:hypothetical protein